MSIDGQEILSLHELRYRFTDRIDELSCLQTQVLLEALRFRNEKIKEALERPSDVRPLDDLVHVLPAAEGTEGEVDDGAEALEEGEG